MAIRSNALKVSPVVRTVVAAAIATGNWEVLPRNRHYKLRHIPSGRMLVAPTSGGDVRCAKNFARDLRHVEAGLPGWGHSPDNDKEIILNPKKADKAKNKATIAKKRS